MKTWEASGCPNGRSVDRGVRLFPVIMLCINNSFPYGKWVANHL